MGNSEPKRPRVLRCAIYTRKSTEDGLEQEFNSLDAQREACAAYILSQRHEGWALVPEPYDDGGFSGGTMDRPGLKQLLAEIEADKVDVIVVYKVDRLTRSLADFARIVDVLDRKGASFVSVTQAFNTTTSMGRLTLNVLLSFAQFEREVTGERIRDKIAASKKKGIWMGGPVPLGYDVRERRLVVNPAEAEMVRHIFGRYLELGSVREVVTLLGMEGWRTKVQIRASGRHRGGVAFGRGGVLHLLKNRIYLGEIVHKGDSYPGEHESIVPKGLWDAVQAKLATRDHAGDRAMRSRSPSLLVRLLHDGTICAASFAMAARSTMPSASTTAPRSRPRCGRLVRRRLRWVRELPRASVPSFRISLSASICTMTVSIWRFACRRWLVVRKPVIISASRSNASAAVRS